MDYDGEMARIDRRIKRGMENARRDRMARQAVDRDPYANAVVDLLREDFPDVRGHVVAAIVKKYIYANARMPGAMEVIVDDPMRANWRLVSATHDRRRVHLGCWRVNPNAIDLERERRLNAALDALEMQ